MAAVIPDSSVSQSPMSHLLTLVAKRHIGEVAAIVISTLISHGKLTAKEISKRSKVPIKLVRTTLVSLIQLNCMYYWQNGNHTEYYFRETGLLVFLHSGEIINYIQSTYDKESTNIIQNLIQIGSIRIHDYLKSFDPEVAYEMEIKIAKLYSDGWLKILQQHDLNPIEDLWNQIYQKTMSITPRSASTSEIKRVAEVKEASKIKLNNLLQSVPTSLYESKGGIKVLNSKLQITFSYSRFEKHLRSKALANLCESRIGLLTANVYSAILKTIENNSPEVHHYLTKIDTMISNPDDLKLFQEAEENRLVDNKKITFRTHDIIKSLPKDLDLRNSILTHNFIKPEAPEPKKRVASFSELDKAVKRAKLGIVKDEVDDGDDDDFHTNSAINLNDTDNSSPQSASLVNHHIRLLATSTSIPFIMELSPGTFTVPFAKLKDIVLECNYEEIIKKTVGSDALRILRCVKQLRLADEKTVSNSVLLKEKIVRNEMYKLIQLNVIEIQEIPRSNDRAASKTFFAFRYKKQNSYNYLRNSIIYNMANILDLIDDFKAEHRLLIDKSERKDVEGNENDLLLESELRILNNLKFREINNIGKLNRLTSLYDVFNV